MKKWAFLLLLCLLFGLCACGSTTQSSQEEAKAMEVENQALLDEIKAQDNYGYDNAFYEKHSYGRGSTTVLVDFDSQTMVQISIRYGKNGKRTSFLLLDIGLMDHWKMDGVLLILIDQTNTKTGYTTWIKKALGMRNIKQK